MGRNKSKPFSRTEIKILVYNKMKLKGMSYENACKEVNEEIEEMLKKKDGKKDNP